MINLEKSSITFGNNVYQSTRDRIMSTLRIPNVGGGGKYLGLPEQFGRRKKDMFQYIQNRVQHKIDGWQTKFLSPARKETLIKSVAYAMPVYSMNCFQLPMELCSDIDSLIARFWWGSTKERRKLSWVAWKKMTTSKKSGGMGFRDLHLFNQALLENQVWKILRRPQSLLYRILKGRYFRDGTIFSATRGTQPSYGWNSLRFGRDLLQRRIQVLIGDGKTTSIGTGPWLPTNPPRAPRLLPTSEPLLKVENLIDTMSHQWNEDQIARLIHPEDHHLISQIYLPLKPKPDSHIWSPTKDGNYTVKSSYWTAMNLLIDNDTPQPRLAHFPDISTSIWKLTITPKLKHFLWRVGSRAIGTADNLRRRNINVNPYCSRCCTVLETCDHTFFTCPYAQGVWRAAGIPTAQICDPSKPMEDKLRQLFTIHNDEQISRNTRFLPFWIMWRLWKARNALVFNRKATTTVDTVIHAVSDTKEWLDNATKTTTRHNSGPIKDAREASWRKPPRGVMKCNYDVSHHGGNRVSGLGWIIRDSFGTFHDCGWGKSQGRTTTEEAECISLIWALQATWGLGYRMVEFEGDNQNINNIINGTAPHPRLQHYIDTIWAWRDLFTQATFTFKPREQNKCADILAKKAISSDERWGLYHSCPHFLNSAVNNDIDPKY